MKKKDRVVLITGASSGIGYACAKEFAKHGFMMILCGRRESKLQDIKLKLESKYGVRIENLHFDIRNQTEVDSSLNSLDKDWMENLVLLINNAGLAKGYAPIQSGNFDHWNTMIDTNIKGILNITKPISNQFIKNKRGHIINVCSTAGHEVYPNGNVYCASKHAVNALTKSMRLDLYKFGIRVSQVSPGHVENTEFALNRFEDKNKAKIYNDFNPLKAKDVAKTIYFIFNQSKHVNIQDVVMM